MNESAALAVVSELVTAAGDDAAVIDDLVLSTDMLHERTDFPEGVSPYTAGWRSVGASLSDIAAMGATPVGAVAVYAAPRFDRQELTSFLSGAIDVCELVGTKYIGGDLDTHEELTIASSALGRTEHPVYRSGATPGEHVYVTGTLGRSASAIACFEAGDLQRGNDLFQFVPRVEIGEALRSIATAMIDSSDGLARSLHQLADASGVGMSIRWEDVPVDPSVEAELTDDVRQAALHFGEDFELVFTAPPAAIEGVRDDLVTPIGDIGTVTTTGVTIDGDPLPDVGYQHGT